MKQIVEIYRYAFKYTGYCLAVIGSNLLYVLFNLLSLVLFIPFLQVIFPTGAETKKELIEPIYNGGFVDFFLYVKSYYQFFMESKASENPISALLFVCVTVLIAFFFKNIFRYLAVFFQSFVRMAVVRDIRLKLFEKAVKLPMSYYTTERKGDLMTRMNNDVNEIEVAVLAVLEIIFRDPIAIIISISTLIYISPQLTLVSFLLLPVSAFIISRIGKSLKRTAKKGQEEMATLFSNIEENLGAMRIIKAFNATDFVIEKFKKINLRHQQLITRVFRKKDLTSPLNEFIGSAVMISLVWFGGKMIIEGTANITGDTFLGFIIIFSQLLVPIQSIANNLTILNKAKVSMERINEVLNTDEKILDAENPVTLTNFKSNIAYKNVSFKYNDTFVVKDFSLTIPQGKIIAIVGESGSGKSTVADLLPRFYDVVSGAIFIDEINIKDISVHALRSMIAIVSQESILFNDTVKNNILFGRPNATNEEVEQAAKIANAHAFIETMENGYDTMIGERGGKLSGGQRQRINIARAVLKNAPILILDEATSALDIESERQVQEALDKLMKDKTSIVIAHRLSTIKNADMIVVMDKGEIAEVGTHEELLAKKGVYFNLYSLQY
ncbi:MAG TPA: ABC transporter ATP-binding protein [Crocinitomicaceae bacterium]|nr:ABC transporter ATP-binding protein [Crocinitomicaceae bacterium]